MYKKPLIPMAIGLLIGLGAGFALGQGQHSHDGDASFGDDHHSSTAADDHGMFMVNEAEAPLVTLAVAEDAESGWNITVKTQNFTFTPQNVNAKNALGEGHAHLYVDGQKVARLYGPSFHYSPSFDGSKTFRVTLNANDHSEYAVNGEVIAAEQTVTHEHHE